MIRRNERLSMNARDIKLPTEMSPPNGSEHLSTLQDCVASTNALLKSFEADLKTPVVCPLKNTVTDPPQNPLLLLCSAASILKAQTTKLSLLFLNSPFTPPAITDILKSLSASCLPALMTALELCPPGTHSALLHNHVRTLLSRAIQAFSALLAAIPQQNNEGSSISREQHGSILSATGTLWETCDGMTQLASTGLSALAIEKLKNLHSLIKDAIAELEEWDPTKDDDDSGTASNPDDSDPLPIPPSRTPQLLHLTLCLLRQIRRLYPAIKKRRLSTFPPLTLLSSTPPPSPSQIQTIDIILTALADFSSIADELACALYFHDDEEVLRLLSYMRAQACDCIRLVMLDWRGEEDSFSIWVRKWVEVTSAMDVGEEGINEEGDGKERDSVDASDDSCMRKEEGVELLRQQLTGGGSSTFESEIPIR